jgi:hypothetical protein
MDGGRRPPNPPPGGDGPSKSGGKAPPSGGGGSGGAPSIFGGDVTTAKVFAAPDSVVVHPLVLLSVVDHYYRMGYKDAKDKRVVGVILGESDKGRVDVVNSFAVPYEEDPRDPGVFYLDHDYLETMYSMFRKVGGWVGLWWWWGGGARRAARTVLPSSEQPSTLPP